MIRTLMISQQRRTLKMSHVILTSCHRDVIISPVLMVLVLDKTNKYICQKSDWMLDM